MTPAQQYVLKQHEKRDLGAKEMDKVEVRGFGKNKEHERERTKPVEPER